MENFSGSLKYDAKHWAKARKKPRWYWLLDLTDLYDFLIVLYFKIIKKEMYCNSSNQMIITDFWSLKIVGSQNFVSYIKQADYLILYEQNWLKEGTEVWYWKKQLHQANKNLCQTDKSD